MKLKIKNFGPIKNGLNNGEFLDIQKFTVFIGNENCGKTTILKLINALITIENNFINGNTLFVEHSNWFKRQLEFSGIGHFLEDDTIIEYLGKFFEISFNKTFQYKLISKNLTKNSKTQNILFSPTERCLINSVRDCQEIDWVVNNLINFKHIFSEAMDRVENLGIEKFSNTVPESVRFCNLSSNVKSALMLTVTAKYMSDNSFTNIVDDFEQGLSPKNQRNVLYELVQYANDINSKLIFSTCSQNLMCYLTLAIQSHSMKPKNEVQMQKLYEIVPKNSTINPNDFVVYQMDSKNGTIEKLETYKGLPSDENYINLEICKCNELFSELLDLEQKN